MHTCSRRADFEPRQDAGGHGALGRCVDARERQSGRPEAHVRLILAGAVHLGLPTRLHV